MPIITNGELLEVIEGLGALMRERMLVEVAWQVRNLALAAQEHAEVLRAQMNALVEQYGARDAEGQLVPGERLGSYAIAKGNERAFGDARAALLSAKIDFGRTLPVSLLRGVSLTPEQLIALDPILEAPHADH